MQSRSFTLSFNHPLRLMLGTVVLAVAAVASQQAWALPGGPHGGPGMEGMGGPGLPMMAPHQFERVLDRINASAEQRSKIRQILGSAHDDLAARRDAGRKLHEQMQALFAQPTIDTRAVESLRQQLVADHDQASKRITQALLDVSAVLTPEQRKQIAERRAQRQSMMQRHRAEREAADGPARR